MRVVSRNCSIWLVFCCLDGSVKLPFHGTCANESLSPRNPGSILVRRIAYYPNQSEGDRTAQTRMILKFLRTDGHQAWMLEHGSDVISLTEIFDFFYKKTNSTLQADVQMYYDSIATSLIRDIVFKLLTRAHRTSGPSRELNTPRTEMKLEVMAERDMRSK